ncbi:hypothetical protein ATDW_24130 [Asticcacaulis sp. DW145]|uniref:hypothetical protein n=1 Tax=Asticcacaulis sp. DW145 TaxID=3095608 RepID=UPI0030865377|nr:hypothetical protein ATDW_24130 [Asticcacaulis sp. DW145]
MSTLTLLRGLLSGLTQHNSILVRRWTYKAIALIGMAGMSNGMLQNRLRSEPDFENRCWLIAAIVKTESDYEVQRICESSGLDFNIQYELASRVFLPREIIGNMALSRKLDLSKEDDLTLMWSSLLLGYEKCTEPLFLTNHTDVDILREMNVSNRDLVSEYSVWALWKNAGYTSENLAILNHDLSSRAPGVRKWVNRLLMKSTDWIAKDLDFFQHLANDDSLAAREGLALGLRDDAVAGIDRAVLGWYDSEQDQNIRQILLEFMARSSEYHANYAFLVEEGFKAVGPDDILRTRLMAASAGTRLHAELRRAAIKEAAVFAPDLFGNSTNIGSITMGNVNTGSINATGSIVALGDVLDSVNYSINTLRSEDPERASSLEDLLERLKEVDDIPVTTKEKMLLAIGEILKNPDEKSKRNISDLFSKVKDVMTLSSATVTVMSAILKIFGM